MNDRNSGAPGSQDFREVAERSRAAGIADESAGYVNASAPAGADAGGDSDGSAGGGGAAAAAVAAGDGGADDGAGMVQVPEGLADETAAPVDMTPDESDSIEPFHIPGSAEDIHVDGETGPGPSG